VAEDLGKVIDQGKDAGVEVLKTGIGKGLDSVDTGLDTVAAIVTGLVVVGAGGVGEGAGLAKDTAINAQNRFDRLKAHIREEVERIVAEATGGEAAPR